MSKEQSLAFPELSYNGDNVAFFLTLLEALLKYLGENCNRAMLAALSGEGNRFCWRDGEWTFGNELIDWVSEIPFEAERRVFSAIGWAAAYVTVPKSEHAKVDASKIRADFMAAIDEGFPVYIKGSPFHDCNSNICYGYEDNGQKILVCRCHGGMEEEVLSEKDSQAPFLWNDWENHIDGYILLREKQERKAEHATALALFQNIVRHARNITGVNGNKIGIAAWESFLYHLEEDDFSSLTFEELKNRFIIYCDALCQINARKEALPYYRKLADKFPVWRENLEKAITALDKCADYGGYLWTQGFSFDDVGIEKFRSREARKNLAEAGKRALEEEKCAICQFEKIGTVLAKI